MKDRFKFRVWHTNAKKFLNNANDDVVSYWFGYIDEPLKVCEMHYGEFADYEKNVIIQQYTGLKDKNGKEIYEGDILSNEDGIDYVYFKNGCFWIDDLWLYDHAYNNEVIGNILENSELLK